MRETDDNNWLNAFVVLPPSEMIDLVDQVCSEFFLNREVLPDQAWQDIVTMVQLGKDCDCPFLYSYTKLTCFDSSYAVETECELLANLASNDVIRVRRSLDALHDWIQQWSDDRRFSEIPKSIISVTLGMIESGNKSWVDYLWRALEGMIQHFPFSQGEEILKKINGSIDSWATRLQYRGVNRSGNGDQLFHVALPDLRAGFTKLCKTIFDRGFANATAADWLKAVANDPMPEIQRLLEKEDH